MKIPLSLRKGGRITNNGGQCCRLIFLLTHAEPQELHWRILHVVCFQLGSVSGPSAEIAGVYSMLLFEGLPASQALPQQMELQANTNRPR